MTSAWTAFAITSVWIVRNGDSFSGLIWVDMSASSIAEGARRMKGAGEMVMGRKDATTYKSNLYFSRIRKALSAN